MPESKKPVNQGENMGEKLGLDYMKEMMSINPRSGLSHDFFNQLLPYLMLENEEPHCELQPIPSYEQYCEQAYEKYNLSSNPLVLADLDEVQKLNVIIDAINVIVEKGFEGGITAPQRAALAVLAKRCAKIINP